MNSYVRDCGSAIDSDYIWDGVIYKEIEAEYTSTTDGCNALVTDVLRKGMLLSRGHALIVREGVS